MSIRDVVLVQVDLRAGSKGLINVDEIAAMEEVQTSGFHDLTVVTLKSSGKEINVEEGLSSLLGRIEKELGKPVVNR